MGVAGSRDGHALEAAFRHAGAVTAIDPLATLKDKLRLTNMLFGALLILPPDARARRVELLDTVLGLLTRSSATCDEVDSCTSVLPRLDVEIAAATGQSEQCI